MYKLSQSFPYKPNRTLHYSIQDRATLHRLTMDSELSVHDVGSAAALRQISIGELRVPVPRTERFTLREMTVLGYLSVGATSDQLREIFASTRKGDAGQVKDDLFCMLNVTAGEIAGNSQAVGLAFKRGLFQPDPRGDEKTLDVLGHIKTGVYRDRFRVLAELFAEGLTPDEAVDIVDFTDSKKTLDGTYYSIRDAMDICRPEMVMIAGGLGMIPTDEEPVFIHDEVAA